MTHLNNQILTDLTDIATNEHLTGRGFTIRHIETWAESDDSTIAWDFPEITETDLPY